MEPQTDLSDGELPELRMIILPHKLAHRESKPLRRSPRKNKNVAFAGEEAQTTMETALSAASNQRRLSPAKASPSKRSPLKTLPQAAAKSSMLDDIPLLTRISSKITKIEIASAGNRKAPSPVRRSNEVADSDVLLSSFSRLNVQSDGSEAEVEALQKPAKDKTRTKAQSSTTNKSNKDFIAKQSVARRPTDKRLGSRFVLDEARCDEDLVDSEGPDNDDEEDTDLSGFIVDDDAEISYHESSEEVDSEEERRSRRKAQREKPRRRLQRGRKKVEDTEDEQDVGDELAVTMSTLRLDKNGVEHRERRDIEVIDLVSPEHKPPSNTSSSSILHDSRSIGTNLFDKFKALKLSPPWSSQSLEIPLKAPLKMWSSSAEDTDIDEVKTKDKYTTPPVTPPRSPSKLKSPSKLLSPSKRTDAAQRSPHRQSMDAFWDLNEVNEWNDQYSPKKAPTASPRKNRLAAFDLWSDGEEDSFETFNESSDSLPSPCESPSKSTLRTASPIKAEKQRLQAEKKARQAEKKAFEETRDQMAKDLLQALDTNITNSRISKLSSSTGGVQIIWSKTLRSTAGRANWRRTVSKPTGSPVKGKSDEALPGTIVNHFANIELAVKIIDRPDRLVNTLAHEFCHLANFMISGIRDQPHGASFQNWARKVTTWMKSQTEVAIWRSVEVTTKHGYVIEWKYLWVCIGRDQNKAMEYLGIEEDGCGAEYGRHSKSVDTETQRCGRCKGRLLQVRPKPRAASPVKKTAEAKGLRTRGAAKGGKEKTVGELERMVEVVELSD